MKRYGLNVVWSVYGRVWIEAESIEEAMEIANSDDTPFPPNPEYLEGSWDVDTENILIMAADEQAETEYMEAR